MAARVVVGVCLLVLTAACSRGPQPPRPTASRTPTVIGVVTQWDWLDCMPGRFTLASGDVVTVVDIGSGTVGCGDRFYTPTPQLSDSGLLVSHGRAEPGQPIEAGDLLFFGEDEDGAWYAAANPGNPDDCPFELRGGAYDEGEALHFSSGLLLKKAPTFHIVNDWVEEPFPSAQPTRSA